MKLNDALIESAKDIEALRAQVAALTRERDRLQLRLNAEEEAHAESLVKLNHMAQERDALETECAVHAAFTKHRVEQLAASQAREKMLHDLFRKHGHRVGNLKIIREALATPSDTTALDELLAKERERCCKRIDEIDDGEAPEYRACQEAIRSLK